MKFMVRNRYSVTEGGFVEDMKSSVLLVHLVSEILRVNLFDDPRVVAIPGSAYVAVTNVSVCLETIASHGIKVNCRAEQVVEGQAEKTVYLLLQLARYFYQKKLVLEEDEVGKKKFDSFLLGAIRAYLKRFGMGPVLEANSLLNFNKNWTDGVFLCALAKTAIPEVVSSVTMEDMVGGGDVCLTAIGPVVDAFESILGIPKLIIPELMTEEPEDCTLHLYLAMFLEKMIGASPDSGASASSSSRNEELVEKLRERITELRRRVVELEAAGKEMLERNDKLQLELYDAHAEVAPLTERLDRTLVQLEAGRDRIQELRTEVKSLEVSRAEVIEEAKRRLEKSDEAQRVAERRFKEALARSQDIAKQCRALKVQFETIIEEKSKRASDDVTAPDGHVTIMFTDIESSTALWEHDAEKMAEALRQHNQVIRKALSQFNGYEVKTEGDAFMVAFEYGWSAILCAHHIQRELLRVPWPEAILNTATGSTQYNNKGTLIWRGVRVRMGLHAGEPELREDPVTHRVDYFGPMVNRAARIEGHTAGGQVNISQAVYDDVHELIEASDEMEGKLLGEFDLKGIREKMNIYQVIPFGLEDREFESSSGSSASTVKLIGGDPESMRKVMDELVDNNEAVLNELGEASKLLGAADDKAASALADLEIAEAMEDPAQARQRISDAFDAIRTLQRTQDILREELEARHKASLEITRTLDSALAQVNDYQSMFSRMPSKSVRDAAEDFLKSNSTISSSAEAALRSSLESAKETIAQLEGEVRFLRRRLADVLSLKSAGGSLPESMDGGDGFSPFPLPSSRRASLANGGGGSGNGGGMGRRKSSLAAGKSRSFRGLPDGLKRRGSAAGSGGGGGGGERQKRLRKRRATSMAVIDPSMMDRPWSGGTRKGGGHNGGGHNGDTSPKGSTSPERSPVSGSPPPGTMHPWAMSTPALPRHGGGGGGGGSPGKGGKNGGLSPAGKELRIRIAGGGLRRTSSLGTDSDWSILSPTADGGLVSPTFTDTPVGKVARVRVRTRRKAVRGTSRSKSKSRSNSSRKPRDSEGSRERRPSAGRSPSSRSRNRRTGGGETAVGIVEKRKKRASAGSSGQGRRRATTTHVDVHVAGGGDSQAEQGLSKRRRRRRKLSMSKSLSFSKSASRSRSGSVSDSGSGLKQSESVYSVIERTPSTSLRVRVTPAGDDEAGGSDWSSDGIDIS